MGQRRRQLTPARSPVHLLGSELRAWRDKAGLSLAELSGKIYYDASHLGKFERGERVPPPEVIRACDHHLQAGGALLRIFALIDHRTPDSDRTGHGHEAGSRVDEADPSTALVGDLVRGASLSQQTDDGRQVTIPARGPDGKVVLVAVSRRALLAGLGVTAAQSINALPLWAGMDSAYGQMIDRSPLEHFQQVKVVLRDSDNLFGPGRVLPTARQQVALMEHVRQTITGADHRALLRLQVQMADLCGWLHQDAADPEGAMHWSARALEWAHMVGDHDAVVFILARRSQLAADMRRPSDAIAAAEAALDQAGPGGRLYSVAATYAAHAHALAADDVAAGRHYEQARRTLDKAEADPDSPWALFFDHGYIDAQQAHSHLVLGDYRTAMDSAERALASIPDSYRRDRGVYLSRQALACLRAGEPERAAAVAIGALSIAAETGSGRIVTELARLDAELAPFRTAPAVAELHHAIADLPHPTT